MSAATASRITCGVADHGTAATTKSGRSPVIASLMVRTDGTPHCLSAARPSSAVGVTMAVTCSRSGKIFASHR
jgi:hypothetical protein